ncbi:MAG: hypothetical protein M3Z64_00330 [Verrucomicrobiota bacterium]|nr:hypothetical protein [Verrucomicrobiota bacterium]
MRLLRFTFFCRHRRSPLPCPGAAGISGETLITYFNFNDGNLASDVPSAQRTTITVNNLGTTFVAPGATQNLATGDTGLPSNMALQLTDANNGGGNAKSFQFTVSTVGFTNLTLSCSTLASNLNFTQTISYSINGGASFVQIGTYNPTSAFAVESLALGSGANNQTSLLIQIAFTQSGQQKGQYNDFDNIQFSGVPLPVPEPNTWLGGAFAVIAGSQRKQFRKLVRRVS